MLANAACARIGPASSAALGTSIITPATRSPWAAHAATNCSASSTVETIGAITQTSAVSAAAARAIAVELVLEHLGVTHGGPQATDARAPG